MVYMTLSVDVQRHPQKDVSENNLYIKKVSSEYEPNISEFVNQLKRPEA